MNDKFSRIEKEYNDKGWKTERHADGVLSLSKDAPSTLQNYPEYEGKSLAEVEEIEFKKTIRMVAVTGIACLLITTVVLVLLLNNADTVRRWVGN